MENNLESMGISVNITDEKDCRKIVSIEVPSEIFHGEKKRVLKKLVKTVSLPGFRKGKVPVGTIKSRFAEEIHNEAIKTVLPMVYEHALVKENVRPIGEPVFTDINVDDDSPLTFNVEIETAPEIELKTYKGLAGKPEKVKVTDENVEDVLRNIQQREVIYNVVEHEAGSNDMVTIDYVPVNDDGEPEEDNRVSDYPIQLGEEQLFPEFEKAIIGRKAGESDVAEINYPDDFKPERLAGLKIKYEFTVKEVKEKKLPEIDDEFASRVDEKFKTTGDLKADIKKRLIEEKERDALKKVEEEVIDRIIEKNPFDVPGSMIEKFKQQLENEDERRKLMSGIPPEEDEEKKKQIDEFFEKLSRRSVKKYFLMNHIEAIEKIEISAEDMDKEIERLAKEGNRPLDEVKNVIAKGSENYGNLRSQIREKRIFAILLDKK